MGVVELSSDQLQQFGITSAFDPSRVRNLEGPGAMETLSVAGQQAGLGIIGQLATIPRVVGDLFNSPTLSQWGRDVNLNAKQAATELIPLGEGSVQRVLREAAVSTGESIPALFSGGLLPALTLMGGQSYLDGYATARDGGLSVGRSHVFAGIDAIFETGPEAWSLPVLFKAGQPFLKAAQEFLVKEMAGEQLTTIGQTMNSLLQLQPNMTVKEYWDNLKSAMVQTALVTPPTAAMQFGIGKTASYLRRSSHGVNLVAPGDLPTGTPPPVSGEPVWPPPAETDPEVTRQAPMPTPQPPLGPEYNPFPVEGAAPVAAPAPTTPEIPVAPPVETATPAQATNAPTVIIPEEDSQILDKILNPEVGPQETADVAVVIPQAQSFTVQVPSDYKKSTPEELNAMPQPDLRLYQGLLSTDGYGAMVSVYFDETLEDEYTGLKGAWVITSTKQPEVMPIPSALVRDYAYFEYEAAKQRLIALTKQELTPEFIKKQHLTLSMRDAVSKLDAVSPEQMKYYGEQLGRIKDKAAFVRAKGLYDEADFPRQRGGDALEGPETLTNLSPQVNDVVDIKGNLVGSEHSEVKDGGVYLTKYAADLFAKSDRARASLKLLSVWAKRYGVKGGIVLDYSIKGQIGNIGDFQGRNGTYYKIEIPVSYSALRERITLAHEFGHALIWDVIKKADPKAVLELTERWLDATTEFYQSDRTWADMGNTGGVARSVISERAGRKAVSRTTSTYSLSFPEFGADQVAQHLYSRRFFEKETPALRQLFDSIADVLKRFFADSKKFFAPNETFKGFLDNLAGPEKPKKEARAKPSKPYVEKTSKGAKVKHKTATPTEKSTKNFDPELVKERAWLNGLLKKHGMFDEETKKSVDPNGTVEGYDFDKAKELLDAIGINWENGSDPYTLGDSEVDEPDTHSVRLGIVRMIPQVEGASETLKNRMGESALSIRNFGRLWRNTLTALQVRKIYGDKIPGVRVFVDALQSMSAFANTIRKRAESGLESMSKAGEEQRTRVFELMIKESEDSKFYNTPKDFADARLNAQGIKLYTQLRDDYAYALNMMESLANKALLEDLNAMPGVVLSPEKAQMVKTEQAKIAKAFAEMRAKPYYPHTRFGDFYAAAKGEDGLIAFTQGETLEDVRRFATAMEGQGITTWYGQMPEAVRPFMGMPYQVFEMMKAKLELTPEQLTEFEDILKNLAPEQSFIRRFQIRKGIEGWENAPEYGPRVYADYFGKFANYAARRMHTQPLNDAIRETRRYKKDMYDDSPYAVDVTMVDRLVNWMEETKEYAMRPDVSMSNVRAAVTLWYLGGSIKSAVVNAFSVPLMTLPWLGKRYGDIKAAAALKQAYMDVGKMFTRPEALAPDERKFLEWLEEVGVADQSYASTMAGVREGGRLMDSFALDPKNFSTRQGRRTAVKSTAYNIKYWAMLPFHKVEVMNRLVTGMAAYRLARAESGLPLDESMNTTAAEIAKDCVQDTQNENQQWNRPELMRGKKSLLTLFMSYTQNAMFQMYGGDQSWQRMLALQLLIAGLMGLPLAKNADDVIQWFAKEVFGTKASISQAIRGYLEQTFIRPEWVLNGASFNLLGSGLNLQSSLSMGNIIPGIDALVMEGTFPERLANAASDVGGAGAAVIIEFMKAMADDNPDAIKRWTRAMPTAAKNVFEGYRMVTRGTVSDAAGDPILNVSGYEGAAKFLGFQSTNVTQEREKRFMQKQEAQYWLTRRKLIFDLYELAEQTNDVSIENRAEDALDEFNDEVPDGALAIRRKDIQNSLNRRLKNALAKEEGIAVAKNQRGIYEEVGRRYSAQ